MGQKNRKRKRKDSKDKGTMTSNMSTNMATSMNQSPTFSQMIAGANDCLNNHNYLLNNSQSNNQSMVLPPPQQHISSTPIIQTVQSQQGQPPPPPLMAFSPQGMMPPPQQINQDISRTQQMTFEMIFANFQTINQKLEKLSLLDQMAQKFNAFERKFDMLTNELKDVKHDLKQQSERITTEEFHYNIMGSRVEKTESEVDLLRWENNELKEQLLEMKTYGMKYNLIFGGIPENIDDENTEEVLKHFMATQLEIDTSEMKFHNVHRLKARRDRKPRNIIAKFVSYKDHEKVKMAGPKLKDKPQFSINQQYPMEIADRRKELFPRMRALRAEGRHVKLVNDQLFVDRELVNPRPGPPFHHNNRPPPPRNTGPNIPPVQNVYH